MGYEYSTNDRIWTKIMPAPKAVSGEMPTQACKPASRHVALWLFWWLQVPVTKYGTTLSSLGYNTTIVLPNYVVFSNIKLPSRWK